MALLHLALCGQIVSNIYWSKSSQLVNRGRSTFMARSFPRQAIFETCELDVVVNDADSAEAGARKLKQSVQSRRRAQFPVDDETSVRASSRVESVYRSRRTRYLSDCDKKTGGVHVSFRAPVHLGFTVLL